MTALLAAAAASAACGPGLRARRPASAAPSATDDHDQARIPEEQDDEDVPPPARPPLATSAVWASPPKAPCASSLAACSLDGCEKAGSAHALLNRLKRRTTDAGGNAITFDAATPVTVADMVALQARAEERALASRRGLELTAAQRESLRHLGAGGLPIGEGDAVRVAGYIVPAVPGVRASGAHEGGPESVNCRVPKPPGAPGWTVHDFHIPVTDRPVTLASGVTECDGVVVEMIPQGRDAHRRWLLKTMTDAAIHRDLVLFVGPLFYDNEHAPNPDCAHSVDRQPRRASLWEVHPVVEFYVCASGEMCKVTSKDGWQRID